MHRKIAPREALEESLDFRKTSAARLRSHLFQQKHLVRGMKPIAVQRAAEVIGCGYEELPEHLRFPGGKGFRIDSMNVRIGHQAKSWQPLLRLHCVYKCRNRPRIENIAPLDGSGHVQVMFDQEMHFRFFFLGKLKPLRRTFQSFKASGHMVFYWHAFADVMQQEGQNQQFALLDGLPELFEMDGSRIGGMC